MARLWVFYPSCSKCSKEAAQNNESFCQNGANKLKQHKIVLQWKVKQQHFTLAFKAICKALFQICYKNWNTAICCTWLLVIKRIKRNSEKFPTSFCFLHYSAQSQQWYFALVYCWKVEKRLGSRANPFHLVLLIPNWFSPVSCFYETLLIMDNFLFLYILQSLHYLKLQFVPTLVLVSNGLILYFKKHQNTKVSCLAVSLFSGLLSVCSGSQLNNQIVFTPQWVAPVSHWFHWNKYQL